MHCIYTQIHCISTHRCTVLYIHTDILYIYTHRNTVNPHTDALYIHTDTLYIHTQMHCTVYTHRYTVHIYTQKHCKSTHRCTVYTHRYTVNPHRYTENIPLKIEQFSTESLDKNFFLFFLKNFTICFWNFYFSMKLQQYFTVQQGKFIESVDKIHAHGT